MIERIAACSVTEFRRRYGAPRVPVILTKLTDGWPARTLWTPAQLGARFGERKVEVRRGGKVYRTALESYIRYLEKRASPSGRTAPEELIYLHSLILSEVLPELLQEFSIAPLFRPNWMELWPLRAILPAGVRSSSVLFMGPAGAASPTHRDRYHTHAWFAQIYGEKRFSMLAPEKHGTAFENPGDRDRSLVTDLSCCDSWGALAGDVDTFTLAPGETLFIPAGWWHSAKCLNTSISLSANYINQSNFSDFRRDRPVAVLPPRLAPQESRLNRYATELFLRMHGWRCSWLGEGNA